MHQTTEAEVMQMMMRRVLTEWRDRCEGVKEAVDADGRNITPEYQALIDALTYALSQVWIPAMDEWLKKKAEEKVSTWRALADVLRP